MKKRTIFLLFAFLLLCAGCSEKRPVETFSTSGQVQITTEGRTEQTAEEDLTSEPNTLPSAASAATSQTTQMSTTVPSTTLPPETTRHVHSYTETVVAPSCTSEGYVLYQCTCGDSYKDQIVESLGHCFGVWEVESEATYTATGLQRRTCTRCGVSETETVPKLDGAAYREEILQYGIQYGCSLGMTYDPSLTLDDSGYYPPIYFRYNYEKDYQGMDYSVIEVYNFTTGNGESSAEPVIFNVIQGSPDLFPNDYWYYVLYSFR